MRKQFDRESGAIIYKHTADELAQAEAIRSARKTEKSMAALCKLLNISKDALEAAMKDLDESEVKEG